MANWEEEMLATMGDGSDPGGSSDDNWSDIDGGELLGLDSPGNAGTAAPPAPMIDLGDGASSIGSDAFGVMPDAFASQPVAAATAHVAAPALAPAPAPAADDVRTRSGEDELDALAQMAQKLGFDPHASPARATVSNPFDAPASTPASIPGGMYRCVADAAATAEFEPDPATVTIERMYRPGEAFYVSEIRATAAGKQRAHTLDGAWVSLKSENGFTLLEPVVDDPFDDNPFDDQPPDSPGDANPFSAAPSGDQTDTNPFSADDDLGPALFPAPQPAPAAATVVAAPVEAVKQTSKKQLAEVVHNFEAESDGDLALTVGDIVVLTKAKEGEAWWKGYIQGNKKVKGLFPASFVQVLEPEPAPAPAPPPQSEAGNPFARDDDWLTKMSSALDGMESSVAASAEMESINASSIGGLGTASPFMERNSSSARAAAAPALTLPSKTARKSLFERIDVNGNGALSLAEIDKAIEDGTIPAALMAEGAPSDYNHKPAIMRAYRAADTTGDGFIQRKEFSKLLAYIVYFNNLWDSFDAMDGNHDHRLSQEEFAAGCERAGFALSSTEVSEEFRRCDADGGGFVLFHEFCSWCAEQSLQLRVSLDESGKEARSVSQRLSPSGKALKPPLARTSLSGPPPPDPGTEEARKQAELRAEIAARALSKKSSPKTANKQDRQSPIGAKRKGFAPIPEEKRFSPRRDIEDKMSPPNPQLVSPTAASLGKGVRAGADGSPGSTRRGAKRPTSRETIFATNSALGHTHIEPGDERTELERANMPKRAARRVQTHKDEEEKSKPLHYWLQQEMANENKKNTVGLSAARRSGTDTDSRSNTVGGSTRWAQHARGVGSKGERPDPASMSRTTVITPDHPHAATFTPELNAQTRRIMAGRREALAAERSSFQHTNYGELLYRDGAEKRAEKLTRQETEAQRMVADKEQMEMEECTFTPVRVTSMKGKYKNYANSVSIVERTSGTMAKLQQKSEAAVSQRQNAELSECTFTPQIKQHRTHKARPAVETRIAQMHDRYAAHVEWISDAQREKEQQKKNAVPTINKPRARSPEQRKVYAEQIERTGGAQPVHNRLHTSYQRHVRAAPVDASQPRTGSPTGTHHSGHATFAGYRDAKPASPTRHIPYDRMEKDIAARRAREQERSAAIHSAVRDHAKTKHTLKTSESLSVARAERAMRARFLDADAEGKGSLTKDQLEEALRGLNVLRANAPQPGSVYKREVGVLEKINLLFDFGDGLFSYRSYERLLRKVFQSKKNATAGKLKSGDGVGGDGSPFSDASETRAKEDEGEDDEGLELLPPDVYDSLVAELIELHAVNKHACATGAGPRKSVRAETLADKVAECTFTPKINHKSRQLEHHAVAARSFGVDSTIDGSEDEGIDSSYQWRQTAAGGDRFFRLYEAGQESLSRKEEFAAVMQEERLEEEGCTFWPMLSTSPRRPRRRRPRNLNETDDNSAMGYVEDDVEDDYPDDDFKRGEPVRLSRAELIAMEETTAARREAEELAEATFHPMTNPPMARRRGAPSTPGTESTDDLTGVNVTPAGFEKTVARMRAKRQEEEQLEAEAALKRAAVAWGSGGGKPTPAKGPSLLARQVDKKPPILKMEVNVGGGKTGLIVVRDGDSPSALAASFARVWQLDASTEARLTRKLEIQMAKVQQSNADDLSSVQSPR